MKKILLIDDRSSLRADLAAVLGFENYDVVEAANGMQGIEQARAHRPDLILCDLMLPGLDGFGVIEALHDDPQTAEIPVIFLSARVDPTTIEQGLELGARCFVSKPFELPELLSAIRDHLHN